jgi:hypothetical protein
VSEAFDLDAVIAEREPKPAYEFRFGGEMFTLPAEPDVRALAAFSGGRLDEALRMLLGRAQLERMEAVEAVLDVDALKSLLESYAAHAGLDLGG